MFIDKLTKEQEKELLNILDFSKYVNSACYQFEKISNGKVIEYHAYDHDYNSSEDYFDVYVRVDDFRVYRYSDERDEQYTKNLRKYLSQVFGKNYKIKLIEHLTEKKEQINRKRLEEINAIDKEINEFL